MANSTTRIEAILAELPNSFSDGDGNVGCHIQQAGRFCRATFMSEKGKLVLDPKSPITQCGACPILTDCT